MKGESTVSLLTPAGVGAIAVVRIAGPAVGDFLEKHFTRRAAVGRCVHGELKDRGSVIDDAVAVLIDNNAVDLGVHGGTWAVKAVIDLAVAAGFSISAEAEAVTDGGDMIETEMLAALPLAQTELALRTLLAQPKVWRNAMTAGFDASQVVEDRSLWRLLHPPRVAIVGAANVGKSTLANQLFAQERSITADMPGTTRDWVGEIANLDGLAVMLVDTPGIRQTNDPIEREAMARGKEIIGESDLVVLVIDASRPLAGEQEQLIARWPSAMRVTNKVDRAGSWDFHKISGLETIATSGQGVDGLREHIRRFFGIDMPYEIKPRWWTLRQRQILERGAIDELLGPKPHATSQA